MRIIVDACGGDKGPIEAIKACREAADEFGFEISLVGNESEIKSQSEKNKISLEKINIIHASDVIHMNDSPMSIMKEKKESSMAKGLKMLAGGEGDAFVSSGNSGALTVGGTLIVKRIKKIKRCAFAPVIPKDDGFFMLIDSGANVECRPEMLCQFGVMGSVYMKNVMLVNDPKVGLANIGAEKRKGGELQQEAYELLSKSGLNFIGNIEARDIPSGAADVVVADGFTGNIILKLYEGMAKEIFGKFKGILTKNLKNKLAACLLKSDLTELKKKMDYKEYGGAPLMGTSKPVFKAHGNADAKTFKSAIRLAGEYAKRNVVGVISEAVRETKTEDKGEGF